MATGVTDVGAREHVMVGEAGVTEQDKATDALKLFTDVTEIVEAVVLPTVVVAEAGDAIKVKSGAAKTFKE